MIEAFWTALGWVAGAGVGLFAVVILFIALGRYLRWLEKK